MFSAAPINVHFLEDSWKVWNEVFEIIWANHFEKISSFYRRKKMCAKTHEPTFTNKNKFRFFLIQTKCTLVISNMFKG